MTLKTKSQFIKWTWRSLVYVPNNIISKCTEQETEENTTSEAPILDPTRGGKRSKDVGTFFKQLQLELMEIYRIHLAQQQRSPSFQISSEHWLHNPKSDHNSWDSRNTSMESVLWSEWNDVRNQNERKSKRKETNTPLNSPGFEEDIKSEIEELFKVNENEKAICQGLWDAAQTDREGHLHTKCQQWQAGKSQSNGLRFHLGKKIKDFKLMVQMLVLRNYL